MMPKTKRKPRSDKGGNHRSGWRWTPEQKAKIRGKPKSELHKCKISLSMRGLSTDVSHKDLLRAKLEALKRELWELRRG